MKILFCANIYEIGVVGPARLAEMLLKINSIYNGKHEIRVLTKDVANEEMPVYKMSYRYPRNLRLFDFFFTGWAFYNGINRVKKDFDFNVVLFGNSINGIFTKLLVKKLPVGGFINDYHCAGIELEDLSKTAGGLSKFLLSYVEKFAVHKLDITFTCSDFLRNMIIKNYNAKPSKIFRLYQSVDILKIPFQTRKKFDTNLITILFVKWRYQIGGLFDLANALKILDEFSFQLTIIGPDETEKKNVYELFNDVQNVKIIFLGRCPSKIVYKELQKNDILCIPSHLEAQGLANIEGMASGIAIVTSKAGGIPEVLNFGENGWLCEQDDPNSLASALRKCILSSTEERNNIATKARIFAEENFDYPVMLGKLFDIMNKHLYTDK